MTKCESCGKGSLKEKKISNYEYPTPMGLVTINGTNSFEECSNCGEVFIPGELIDKWNRLILESLGKKNSRFAPQELEFVFSVLPFTQSEIAAATGKDRSTISHYKTGKNPVDLLFEDTVQQMILDFIGGKDTTMTRLKERSQFLFSDEKIRKIKGH
jgi:hypothetical protein